MGLMDGVKTRLGKGALFVKERLRSKTGKLHETFASETILRQQEEITRLQEEIATMIKYPPTPSGVPVLTEGDILFAYRGIIKETYLTVGMLEGTEGQLTPCFMNTYMYAIRQVISYFHLLPASEYHHHNEVGGLLRHSLEVALITLRMAKGSRPAPIGYQDEELLREPRWRFAAWLAGLLHDAGKIISDVRVSGKEMPTTIWNPQIETIYEFSERHGIQRYTVSWNPQRANHYHEKLAILMLDKVLSDTAKRWLYETRDNLSGPIIDALQGYTRAQVGYIETPLRRADALSSERDRRTQFHALIGERKQGKGHGIISAIRHLRKNKWSKVNEIGARIFVIDDEVYLDYRNGIQEVINHLNHNSAKADQLARIEADIKVVLGEMEELGIVEPIHEESDYVRITFEGKQGKVRQTDIVRISYPTLVFEGEILPPNMKKCEIELSSMGEKLVIDEKGKVSYSEPKKNPYETLYNLDPDKGSQVNRNKNRTLNLPGAPKNPEEMDVSTQKPSFSDKQKKQIPTQVAGNNAAGNTKAMGGRPSSQPSVSNNAGGQKPIPAQSPAPTNSGQPVAKSTGSQNNQNTPANKSAAKPAGQKSGQGKQKAAPKPAKKPIIFENESAPDATPNPEQRKLSVWDGMNIGISEDEQKMLDVPNHSSVWTGMDINAGQTTSSDNKSGQSLTPTPPARFFPQSESKARTVSEPELSVAPAEHRPKKQKKPNTNASQSSKLKSVRDGDLRTLCYLVAWGLAEGYGQADSLITYSTRPALFAKKAWLTTLAEMKNSDINSDTFFDRYGDSLNPGKLLGLTADDYVKLNNDAVRAIAEMYGFNDKTLMEQTGKLNDFGRSERLANPGFFHGKLKVGNLQEKLILESNLAKELNLLQHGVLTSV